MWGWVSAEILQKKDARGVNILFLHASWLLLSSSPHCFSLLMKAAILASSSLFFQSRLTASTELMIPFLAGARASARPGKVASLPRKHMILPQATGFSMITASLFEPTLPATHLEPVDTRACPCPRAHGQSIIGGWATFLHHNSKLAPISDSSPPSGHEV